MVDSDYAINKCPIGHAVNLISKKWSVLIIRDMFFGKSRFNEFKEDNPGLSNKVLSNCLKDLENNELIIKKVDENNIISYVLSDKGLSLNKVLYELAIFSLNSDLDNKYYTQEDKKEINEIFKKALNID